MGLHLPRVPPGEPRSDAGFTIIEVMMACLVLVVGMLGVLSLVSGSLRTTKVNSERVGAANLARRLIEQARTLDYEDLTGLRVPPLLQASGELGSGSPWTFEARGVTYTITSSSCTYDDPTDGLASPPPDGVCLPQPAGSPGDSNGDDFRRTTFSVAWLKAGASGSPATVTQTMLEANPSGGLGPRIVSFTPVTQTITTSVSSVSVDWTTTPAESLRWTVDDGASAGSSSGLTSFRSTWDIGSTGSGSSSEILDGSYQISAQPFDDRGIAGEVKRADVVLNRRRPYAPTSFAGGQDTRLGLVDLQWSPNRERDILGYRVVRVGLFADVQVCPDPSVGAMLAPAATSCADTAPPAALATYRLVAIDRAVNNLPRDGDIATLVTLLPSLRPAAPGTLAVATVNGAPRLSWTAPASGSVSFYRIYRDGTDVGYADRYDRTSGAETTYVDTDAAPGPHRYWITAVNGSFNESTPIGPVTWSAG
jgi:type II secretory pathway pseudopilin PulG